jgi:uncharacterized tellurite resistance protein B-like protein
MEPGEREKLLDKLRDTAEVWLNERDPSLELGAMIETAFLMAAADGDLSALETDQLVATIGYVAKDRYDGAQIRTMLEQLLGALQTDGWDNRIAAVAKSLQDGTARRNAYRLAAGVAFVDGQVQEGEARLFALLAQAFEIPEKEASWILTEVRDELFGDDASPDQKV